MLPKCVALPASAEHHGAASSFVPVAEEAGAKGYQHNQNATLVVARVVVLVAFLCCASTFLQYELHVSPMHVWECYRRSLQV